MIDPEHAMLLRYDDSDPAGLVAAEKFGQVLMRNGYAPRGVLLVPRSLRHPSTQEPTP